MLIFVRKNEWHKTHYQIREFIEHTDTQIRCWNKTQTKILYFDLWKPFNGETYNFGTWREPNDT